MKPPLCPAEFEPVAEAVFGDRLELASRYCAALADTGLSWGLIGPREVPILWERHLINCALAAALVPAEARVTDVGSGAGLPGLVWAIARPDLRVTLVEPLLRRANWLELVSTDLGVEVVVVRARAEELATLSPQSLGADVVTARAVAPLGKLAGWTKPLVAGDGEILALKGRSAAEEIERAAKQLRKLRLSAEVLDCGQGVVPEPTRVVRLRPLSS